MKWEEVRRRYPDQWLLVEAIKAHSDAGKRIVEQLSVVSEFPDSVAALKDYAQLHREAPERELYVLHTSREGLDIAERMWLGIRNNLQPQEALSMYDDGLVSFARAAELAGMDRPPFIRQARAFGVRPRWSERMVQEEPTCKEND